jgi:hypothetical protein
VGEAKAFFYECIDRVRIVTGRIDLAPQVPVAQRSFDVSIGNSVIPQNIPPVDDANSQSDCTRSGFEQLRASRGRAADQKHDYSPTCT